MHPQSSLSGAQQAAVYVVATPEGTDAALRTASEVASQQGAQLVLIVPQLAEPGESLDARARTRQWFLTACERQAKRVRPQVEIRTSAGDTLRDAIERVVPRRATVVIAGPGRVWWPSRIQRLTGWLMRRGYDPIFVSLSMPGPVERYMWRRVLATHGAHLFGDQSNQSGR